MKKVTTVIMVLSLVLGSVALVAAAEVSQPSEDLQLSALQEITDQEAQEIRGTGLGFGYQFSDPGTCSMINLQQQTQSCILDNHPIRDRLRLKVCQ